MSRRTCRTFGIVPCGLSGKFGVTSLAISAGRRPCPTSTARCGPRSSRCSATIDAQDVASTEKDRRGAAAKSMEIGLALIIAVTCAPADHRHSSIVVSTVSSGPANTASTSRRGVADLRRQAQAP
jgi:hypothetical protein